MRAGASVSGACPQGISCPRIWLDSAKTMMSVMSPLSRPPRLLKNFIPLRFQGRWLAVIITAPSASNSGNTVDMNMAGVEAMPQSMMRQP